MSDSGIVAAPRKYSLNEKFQAQLLGLKLEDDNEGMADVLKSEANKRSLANLKEGNTLVKDHGVPAHWVEQALGIRPSTTP